MSKYKVYFPLVDRVPGADYGVLSLMGIQYRAKLLGEYREPKAGEWYISGAIPEAYRAKGDYKSKYQIAVLIKVRKVEYFEEVT